MMSLAVKADTLRDFFKDNSNVLGRFVKSQYEISIFLTLTTVARSLQ